MIGKRPSASIKKIATRPKTSTARVSEDEDDDDYVPTPPKRAKPVAGVKKVRVEKIAEIPPKPTSKLMVKSSMLEDEDDDLPDDTEVEDLEKTSTKKEVKKAREIALRNAHALGVQSFEAEPEEFLDESVGNEKRYDNMRANDEKIIVPAGVAGADKSKVRGLTTLFGQRSDVILNLLDNDNDTDGALTLIHRTLLQTLVDVLPVVERAVRRSKGKRGVIPFNQVISQVRELVTDIQSIRDKGQLGASIVDRVVRPAYLDLASQVVMAFMTIESEARTRMSPDDFATYRDNVLLEVKKNLAKYLQGQYETIRSDVVSSLS